MKSKVNAHGLQQIKNHIQKYHKNAEFLVDDEEFILELAADVEYHVANGHIPFFDIGHWNTKTGIYKICRITESGLTKVSENEE